MVVCISGLMSGLLESMWGKSILVLPCLQHPAATLHTWCGYYIFLHIALLCIWFNDSHIYCLGTLWWPGLQVHFATLRLLMLYAYFVVICVLISITSITHIFSSDDLIITHFLSGMFLGFKRDSFPQILRSHVILFLYVSIQCLFQHAIKSMYANECVE